jgi:GTP-binding protein of the ras superfamily involved in termination of M-phase
LIAKVVNDAAALFFCFDLTRPSTLSSVKEWHRNARELNPRAAAFLVGTKFDEFLNQVESLFEKSKQVSA